MRLVVASNSRLNSTAFCIRGNQSFGDGARSKARAHSLSLTKIIVKLGRGPPRGLAWLSHSPDHRNGRLRELVTARRPAAS